METGLKTTVRLLTFICFLALCINCLTYTYNTSNRRGHNDRLTHAIGQDTALSFDAPRHTSVVSSHSRSKSNYHNVSVYVIFCLRRHLSFPTVTSNPIPLTATVQLCVVDQSCAKSIHFDTDHFCLSTRYSKSIRSHAAYYTIALPEAFVITNRFRIVIVALEK